MMPLPAPRVRALTLGAVVVLVVVECGGGTCAARHTATGAFGYGADEEAALAMLRTQMEDEHGWYAAHAALPMTGITARIRTAYARLFGESV